MAEYVYRTTVFGPQTFTVADEGGIVEFKGKQLSAVGGYLSPGGRQRPLTANLSTLEAVARHWWKRRTQHIEVFGHKANGVEP